MSSKKMDTSIDDLAEMIVDLAASMDKGFADVRQEIKSVDTNLRQEIKLLQQETRSGFTEIRLRMDRLEERMEHFEGNQQALDSDVRELYNLYD